MTESRPDDLFQPGDLVNNTYRIEALLGRGGTSDVYRARSEISGRLFAIKVLKAEFSGNDDYLYLLTREEEIREIRHDAVVRYSENNRTADGHIYLLMDYVDGVGLDRKIKQGPMPAEDLLVICRRVMEGLRAAHTRNIVHRDLSPDNIILKNDNPAEAVIIDFGIAKDTNPGAETIVGNEFAGKYAYAAPEQLSGKADARADIYSLGALLLACFRGAAPEIGNNPMEVLEKKSQPLDLSDLPEPLHGILGRMTHPDIEERFQNADEVLEALDRAQGTGDTAEDRTVIAPRPASDTGAAAPETAAPQRNDGTATGPPDPPATPARSGSRGLVVAGLVAVLAVGGLAGAYVTGILDSVMAPQHAEVDPYTLTLEKPSDGTVTVAGHAPSEEIRNSLLQIAEEGGGQADITLASGPIAESWGADVLDLVGIVSDLDEWRVAISNQAVELSGKTSDRDLHDSIDSTLSAGLPGDLQGTPRIELEPFFLPVAELKSVMQEHADCGPLQLRDPPETGYAPDMPVTVQGMLTSDGSRIALFEALSAVAGEREVELDIEVLNPSLCQIEHVLPKAPPGNIGFAFGHGSADKGDNTSGRYFVGENPVIDVMLPPEVTDGYLTVAILDVSGNVFHLLPNINRLENRIATLRDNREGAVPVRVAYSIQEAEENGRLAFRVDDSTLGKSKVVAIHSSAPLFTTLRPTTESASGYAQALQDKQQDTDTQIHSLDSRIMITAEN